MDSGSDVEHEIGELRELVLSRVLLLCLAALLTALLATLRESIAQKEYALPAVLAVGALGVGWAALSTRAPLWWRQMGLIAGLLAATLGIAFRSAFLTPNAFSGHLMLVVLVALVMGRRAAWGVLALVLLSWCAVASRFVLGVALPERPILDPSAPRNWLRVLVIFAVVAVTCVAAVTYLMDKMIGAVRRAEALRHALTEESAKRIAALEEQQRLQEHLRQARKLEALGTLAGGVAHDFNNLLTIILSHAELASALPVPQSAKDSLTEIREAGERAAGLTRQLLAFGRRQVAKRTALEVDRVVADTLRLLGRLLPASIELDVQTAAAGCSVWADDIELSQVVMNLCVNARDAMPQGGHLTISTQPLPHAAAAGKPKRGYVRIQIRDNGAGMDAQTLARVFEPFFTTKQAGAGTGLGLSTVHGIVEQLGGFTQIESAPRSGTTVSVWLPRCGASAAESDAPGDRQFTATGHESLLVVDDDQGAREVIASQLRRAGYQVVTCEDGQQAWELYQQRSAEFSLIVSDAIMPRMGGHELHRHILQEFGEVPFLVCSGYTDETFERDFFTHPLRAFLGKPFTSVALLEQVRTLLDRAKTAPRAGQGLADRALSPKACT